MILLHLVHLHSFSNVIYFINLFLVHIIKALLPIFLSPYWNTRSVGPQEPSMIVVPLDSFSLVTYLGIARACTQTVYLLIARTVPRVRTSVTRYAQFHGIVHSSLHPRSSPYSIPSYPHVSLKKKKAVCTT